MATYIYEARDAEGRHVQGEQHADSEALAVRILQGRGLVLTRLADSSETKTLSSKKTRRHRKIRQSDLLLFIRETATLLDAGIPLLQSLDVVANLIESDRLVEVLRQVRDDVRSGATFTGALTRRPEVFPALWANLVQAGETSGNLPLVLRQLADHIEATIGLKKKIVSAMIYPALLILVSIVAVVIFLVKIIPVFSDLFKTFNAKLPALTLAVITLSDFLRNYFLILAIALAISFFFFRQAIGTPTGKRRFDAWVLDLPAFGSFVRDSVIARITVNLSTLIKSGINLLQALDIAAKASGNAVYETALRAVAADVQQGQPFSESLAKNPLFPPMLVQMTKIGEESGRLSDMMDRVAHYYQDRVDVFIARMSVLIEPLVLIVVGSIIGVLVVSMFLPIFSLSNVVR